ncbi:Protein phosphatase 2C (PP2C)-like domain [Macleaya cordata]|uniref:protein-serine/threonine phosphatase n=1 Tax=Macleaya cordata TaxID=56857 RepID=A0A200QWE6_MACCD|nr:Protein phosphatase 2C (PP2C)-like domain [Macleaya cordata]
MGSCLSADGANSHPYSPTSPSGARRHRKNKKQGLRSSSFDARRSEQLRRIPGRMFFNGASGVASLFTQQGKKGTNQDAMINFGSRTDTVFCGVFDGHGPFGHMVAKRVRDSLPLKLSAHWEVNIVSEDASRENSRMGSMNLDETTPFCVDEESGASMDLGEKEKHPEIFLTLKESFLKAFKVMDKELRMHPNIDCFCSGTTAVTLVKQGQDLIIGNVGDSRAILGTRDQDDSLIAVQLTVDLKPNLPKEAERIKQCRGRVFALQDEPEVSRIWLPNCDSPGLAMARAFGDFCLKDFGLISVPEVTHRRLSEKDEFVVLATDGVWDVLSNKEVVDIVASSPTRSSASRVLVETAVRAWRSKYPTSKVDDCAVVCLFLNSNPINSPTSKSEDQPTSEDLLNMGPTELDRSGTLRTGPEILPDEIDEETADLVEKPTGYGDWSALEGVSRVNTLLTLPRYVAGKDEKPSKSGQKARK